MHVARPCDLRKLGSTERSRADFAAYSPRARFVGWLSQGPAGILKFAGRECAASRERRCRIGRRPGRV
jgi:hypothetical protein